MSYPCRSGPNSGAFAENGHLQQITAKELHFGGCVRNAAQKFQRNKQAGGGAYIPATIQVEGPREHKEAVLDRVRTSLTECENGKLMSIDIEN